MEYRQQQLGNGLQVLAECNPRAHTAAFGFFVRTGSRDESPELAGVSHFLEHMAFKGTPYRTAAQVNLELDEMGASSNARTSEESTIYHAAVLPEFQTPVVELLADIMRPSLREDDFETEKQVIIEEIHMYDDQPPYGGYEAVMESFFGDHSLGQSVLGTEESVAALTPEQMREYFQRRYAPSNICVAAAGNVDFHRLVDDVARACDDWQPQPTGRDKIPAVTREGWKTLYRPQSTQQYILQLAPGVSSEDERRYAASIAAAVLGDDSGSRMYWEFLDPGRAESAGVGSYDYQGAGAIMSYLCCAPEQAEDNLRRLTDLQQQVVEEGITSRELELAKRKIASRIVLASERTETRMFSVGSQWLSEERFKTVGEIAEIYDAVTLEEVNEVIRAFPLVPNMTVVVGPRQDWGPLDG